MTTITRLQAENYKRIVAVDITAQATNLVPITGKNAQGKSSLLDAIQAAIGGKDYTPTRPIRTGQEEAAIRIELSDGLIVRRIFTEDGKGDKLFVEDGKGMRASSPQAVLNKLFSSVAFDPVAFTREKPKDQLEQLRRLVEFDVDLEKIATGRKANFDARTDINREVRRLELEFLQAPHHADAPAEPTDLAPMEATIENAAKHNGDIEGRKARRAQVAENIKVWNDDVASYEAQLIEIQGRLDQARAEATNLQKQLDEAPPLPEPIDVAEAMQALRNAQAANEKARANQRRKATELALEHTRNQATALTTAIEAADKARAEAFERAKMPVPGLSFGDDQVLFNGVPLDQASAAEQLRISTAIGIATSPDLRVMLIRDASLLDEEGMALLVQMAVENDFQFWIETVDRGEHVGIVIEDGSVKDAPTPEPIEKPKKRSKKPEPDTQGPFAGNGGQVMVSDPSASGSDGAENSAPGGGAGPDREGAPPSPEAGAPVSPEPEAAPPAKDPAVTAAVDALLETAAAAPAPNFAGFHVEQAKPPAPRTFSGSLFDDDDEEEDETNRAQDPDDDETNRAQ